MDDPAAARPRFVSLTSANGLASNNVRSITEDLFGNLYVGTARGVDRLAPNTVRIKHYSINDGLAGDLSLRLSVMIAARSGSGHQADYRGWCRRWTGPWPRRQSG